jgi:hypothetical protein
MISGCSEIKCSKTERELRTIDTTGFRLGAALFEPAILISEHPHGFLKGTFVGTI